MEEVVEGTTSQTGAITIWEPVCQVLTPGKVETHLEEVVCRAAVAMFHHYWQLTAF